MGLVDIHTHVLPGIDDGPADVAGSVAMAELAVEHGTEVLVATPHVREDHPDVVPGEVASRVAALQRTLDERGIALQVRPGGEIGALRAMELSDQELREVTLGGTGTWLLVETPHGEMPTIFEELLDRLRERGFRLVLAHPELSPTLQRDPGRLERMVGERDVLVQLTARSLLRDGRKSRIRGLAERALDEGWVSVLASDAHAADWRPPDLGRQLQEIVARHPARQTELLWMAREVPAALIAGVAPPPRPPRAEAPRRRGFLRRAG